MKKTFLVLVVVAAAILIASLFHAQPAAACEQSVCGNGVVEEGEQCDDKNRNDEDACSNKCQKQIIKEVIKEVPVEKIVEKEVIIEKEVPVEKLVTIEKVVEIPVEKIVKKIVYKKKSDHDKDKKDSHKDKKELPRTGLPLFGLLAMTLSTAGAYGIYRKLKR